MTADKDTLSSKLWVSIANPCIFCLHLLMTSLFMYSFCRFTFYYPIHSPISTEPGVPYTVTVRASTAVGKGEPVSIVVFSVQQGDIDTIEY